MQYRTLGAVTMSVVVLSGGFAGARSCGPGRSRRGPTGPGAGNSAYVAVSELPNPKLKSGGSASCEESGR